MTRRSIGGELTLAALALLVGSTGRQYRERDRDELRVAVHELRDRGLDDHQIAGALGIGVEMVRRMLGERP